MGSSSSIDTDYTEDTQLRSHMMGEQHGCPVKPRIAQD